MFPKKSSDKLQLVIYRKRDDAHLLPNTALAHLEDLRQHFPEKSNESELLELKMIPYYFGVNRPYLHQRSHYEKDFYYPISLFEQANIVEAARMKLLERFIRLRKSTPRPEWSLLDTFVRTLIRSTKFQYKPGRIIAQAACCCLRCFK